MKKIIFTLIILTPGLFAHAQEISRNEADSLLLCVKKSNTADTNRLNSLLALASFNILKPGEFKADFDCADAFIKQAIRINSKIRSPEANAYLELLTACLHNESGRPNEVVKDARLFFFKSS